MTVADPPGVVITTSTAPAVFAGVTTVTDVALTLVTDRPAVPPKVTDDVPVKFVPVIVTDVPPAAGPDDGEIPVTVGAARYVNPPANVPDKRLVMFVTTTSAVPFPAGVTAVIDVSETTTAFVAAFPPIVTVAPARKPVPVIVTDVPPDGKPLFGEIAVTVGCAAACVTGTNATDVRKIATATSHVTFFNLDISDYPRISVIVMGTFRPIFGWHTVCMPFGYPKYYAIKPPIDTISIHNSVYVPL